MKMYKFRCPHCGTTVKKLLWWVKLKLAFNDRHIHHCPNCNKMSVWKDFFNLRLDILDPQMRNENKSRQFIYKDLLVKFEKKEEDI